LVRHPLAHEGADVVHELLAFVGAHHLHGGVGLLRADELHGARQLLKLALHEVLQRCQLLHRAAVGLQVRGHRAHAARQLAQGRLVGP
jgi:hypothetical protein